MSNIITHDNFNAEKIYLSIENNKQFYSNETYHFTKIYPMYKYPSGEIEPIFIQIPEVASYGIKSFNNNTPGSETSHSFSFSINVKPIEEENISDKDAEKMTKDLIYIFTTVESRIKQFLKETATVKKLGKKNVHGWDAFVDNIKPVFNYQTEKETGERIQGAHPTLYVKLKTEIGKKNPNIKTVFQFYDAKKQCIEEVNPHDAIARLQSKKCTATGVVQIESIFVQKTNNISIQYKLNDLLVTDMIKTDISRLRFPSRLVKAKTEDSDSDLVLSSDGSDVE